MTSNFSFSLYKNCGLFLFVVMMFGCQTSTEMDKSTPAKTVHGAKANHARQNDALNSRQKPRATRPVSKRMFKVQNVDDYRSWKQKSIQTAYPSKSLTDLKNAFVQAQSHRLGLSKKKSHCLPSGMVLSEEDRFQKK